MLKPASASMGRTDRRYGGQQEQRAAAPPAITGCRHSTHTGLNSWGWPGEATTSALFSALNCAIHHGAGRASRRLSVRRRVVPYAPIATFDCSLVAMKLA